MDKEKIQLDFSQISSSFNKVNLKTFYPEFMSSLTKKEEEMFLRYTLNKELWEDILLISEPIIGKAPYETPKDLKLEILKGEYSFPKIKNWFEILKFLFFIKSIQQKTPRPNLIYKKVIQKEFGINDVTLGIWLNFFNRPFKDNRKFSSRQYADIINDFTRTDVFNDNIFHEFAYKTYSKKKLFNIVSSTDTTDSNKYCLLRRKMQTVAPENDDDNDFLEWMTDRRKVPLSLAYRFLMVLNKYEPDLLKGSDIKSLLQKCWDAP